MIKEKTKTVTLTTNQTVRIPTQVVKKMGLDTGADFDVSVQGDTIVLTPLIKIPKSQRYYWTKEWQEAEQKVDEDSAAGRTSSFDSFGDFVKDLESHGYED